MGDRQDAKNAKGLGLPRFVEPSEELDSVARRVIGSAIEVHRQLGPGFVEAIYEEALAIEFGLRGIDFVRQPRVLVTYKGQHVGLGTPDFIVEGCLVVELKVASSLLPLHQAQVISYLRAVNSTLGLLLNFSGSTMRSGMKRVVWNRQKTADDVNERDEAS